MKKLLACAAIALFCLSFYPSEASAFYLWRYREDATDCTALTDGKVTDLCYENDDDTFYKCEPTAGDCDTAAEWRKLNTTGNATTATALAANGANCSAGNSPLGVDASGAAEGCFAVLTAEVDGSTTNEIQNLFETISTSSGTSPVADSATDTLTLTGGTGITITGVAGTDTITIATTVVDTDTNANTICAGTTTYLDGEGNCDDISLVYQPLEATLTDIADGTIAEDLVNTANPWADNEVADTITASNYLPLAGGTLTGELKTAAQGIEGTATDTLTDCSTFSATGGGIFYDDSEGKWKKCQDNVLSDMDTGGSKPPKEYWWPASATLPLEHGADSIPPISKNAGTNVDTLDVSMDDSTDECRTVSFKVPSDVTSGGTVTFRAIWYSKTATTGNVILDFRHSGGQAEGASWDTALTTIAAAADATQGTVKQETHTTWTSDTTTMGWAANDHVSAEFCRDANNASDTMTGDLELIGVGVEIPRT